MATAPDSTVESLVSHPQMYAPTLRMLFLAQGLEVLNPLPLSLVSFICFGIMVDSLYGQNEEQDAIPDRIPENGEQVPQGSSREPAKNA